MGDETKSVREVKTTVSDSVIQAGSVAVTFDHFEGGWIAGSVHFVRELADMQHLLVRVLPETEVHLHDTVVRLKE